MLTFTTRGQRRTPSGLLVLTQLQVSFTCSFPYVGRRAASRPALGPRLQLPGGLGGGHVLWGCGVGGRQEQPSCK